MMSHTLTAKELKRLVCVLGHVGSDHDGERAAAGLLASRILRERGLTWDSVIAGGCAPAASALAPAWRANLHLCLQNKGSLRLWERDFVSNLDRQSTVSRKQRSALTQIAQRLREGAQR